MNRPSLSRLAPQDVVAAFDSATVLHAGLAAALRGQPFPHLGHSASAAAAVRVGGRLPWPVLRWLYTRIGASEAIDPHRLADVDMAAVAGWLAHGYPQRPVDALRFGERFAPRLLGPNPDVVLHQMHD